MFLGIGVDTRWISDTCVCLPATLSLGPRPDRLFESNRREVVLLFKDDLPLNEFVEVCLPLTANPDHPFCAVVLRDCARLVTTVLFQSMRRLDELLNRCLSLAAPGDAIVAQLLQHSLWRDSRESRNGAVQGAVPLWG